MSEKVESGRLGDVLPLMKVRNTGKQRRSWKYVCVMEGGWGERSMLRVAVKDPGDNDGNLQGEAGYWAWELAERSCLYRFRTHQHVEGHLKQQELILLLSGKL